MVPAAQAAPQVLASSMYPQLPTSVEVALLFVLPYSCPQQPVADFHLVLQAQAVPLVPAAQAAPQVLVPSLYPKLPLRLPCILAVSICGRSSIIHSSLLVYTAVIC